MGVVNSAMALKLYRISRMNTAEVARVLNCTEADIWNILSRNDKKATK